MFQVQFLLVTACLLDLAHTSSSFPAASHTRFAADYRRILQDASRRELYEFFQQLPKGGILHLHSEYAVSPELWLKLATNISLSGANQYFTKMRESSCPGENGSPVLYTLVQRATLNHLSVCERNSFKPVQLLSQDELVLLAKALKVESSIGGRAKFFEQIVPRLDDLWRDPDLMLQVIPELVREAASEHIEYLELQLDPTSLHDAQGSSSPPDAFVEKLNRRLALLASSKGDVIVRFQMEADRNAADPRKELSNAFQFVNRHDDLWVGVNLLGEEGMAGGEVSQFTATLRELRSRYDIPLSLHAGELDSAGRQVRDALIAGASRIGHAVNLITDPDTMLLMRHGDVPIETSLVSNKLLGYTPDLSRHPFPLYLRSGIPMCLNTDDPGAFGNTLTDEFFLAATLYNLSWKEIVGLARASIEYSFAGESTKLQLSTKLDHELETFETRMSNPNWRTELDRPLHSSDFAQSYLHLER